MQKQKFFLIIIWACIALTPTFTYATPPPIHATPTKLDDGKDTPTSIAHVPRLAPVYPLLDTTLGILSFAAFAVYILMLLGGHLAKENPTMETVNRWEM